MINIAVIGTGSRAAAYVSPKVCTGYKDICFSALCDINRTNLEAFCKKWFSDRETPRLYTDYMDVMNDPEVQAVIITTPDTTHRAIAVAALEHGKHVMLEKPLATSLEDTIAIYRARMEHPELAFRVGFTLRHTPFYSKVKQLLDEGAIGTIISIEAKEALDRMHGASFFRRWHRFSANNGGFLNAKCSHDMDILTWLTGEKPLYMSAFGSRSYFVPNREFAAHCRDCSKTDTCKYAVKKEPDYWPVADLWDLCPFNADGDIVDREVVNIEYTNGVVASFTVSMISAEPHSNRTICIHGSEGSIDGDIASGIIRLRKTHPSDTQIFDVTKLAVGGHSGGDPRLFSSFVDAILTGESLDTGDALGGMYASVLAISSLEAMQQHKVIDIQALLSAYQL